MTWITVQLDGRPRALADGSTLAQLVAELGLAPPDVATAVNGSFVARERRDAQRLRDGDAVLLFQPIVGG
jgi:sulfur carrier protein